MKMLRLPGAAVWLLCLVRLAPAADDLSMAQRVEQVACPLTDSETLVGLSMAILHDGKTEFITLGRVDEKGQRPTPDTVYEIGSVTKVLTAVLLADMQREGLVAFDQPVTDLLPQELHGDAAAGPAIHLAQLSTHTSGLPRLPDNFEPADPTNPYADYDEKRLFAFLKKHGLTAKPDAAVAYSNLGVGLLGHVLAAKAGISYEDLMVQRICDPLALKDTRVSLTEDMRARLAPGHDGDGRPVGNWDLAALAGAGGVRSTAREIALFLAANMEPSTTPLGPALLETHQARHALPGGRTEIGLGWHITDGARWHNGGTGGYHSFAGFDPQSKVAVVALSNSASDRVDELGFALLRLLNGQDVEPLKVRAAAAVDPGVLAAYAGKYELVPNFAITVTHEDGKLMAQATGQEKFRIYPKSDTEFFYRVVDAQVTFVKDGDGKVEKLILHQNGRELPGKKIE